MKLSPNSINKQAFHWLWGSASSKMPIHAVCFWQAVLTHKVGQIVLFFGVLSGFISRSVHATSLVFYAAITICATLVNIHTHRQTALWPACMNSSELKANLCLDDLDEQLPESLQESVYLCCCHSGCELLSFYFLSFLVVFYCCATYGSSHS